MAAATAASLSQTQLALQDALDAFSQGEVERARSILDVALEEDQSRGDLEEAFAVCCMRASMAAMEGDTNVADLMGATPHTPYNAAVTCYIEGLAAMTKGNLQTARVKFEEAKRRDHLFVLANVGLAAIHFQTKEYKKSFAHYREVLGVLGSTVTPPIVRVGMGLCAYYLNRLDFAQKLLERALEINHDDELALLGLLVVYLDRRLIPKVIQTVVHLRKILPHNALVLLKVADLMYFKAVTQQRVKLFVQPIQAVLTQVRHAGTAEEIAMADFQEGRALLVSGDLAGARPLLESALRTIPTLLAARVHYARLLLHSNKEEDAIQLLVKITKEYPNQKESLLLLAAHATRNGQHEAALQYCRRLTESVAQDDPQSWWLAAWCARLDTPESLRLLKNVHSIHRELGQAPSWQLLANIAVLSRDTEALQALVDKELGGNFLSQTTPLDVQYVPLIFNLALLLEQHDRTRARQLYMLLVKQHATFRLPYYRLHTLAKEDGFAQQAAAWLTLLQQVIPGEPLAQTYLGRLFFEQKRHMAAMDALRALPSKSVPVALALGAVYLWCSQQHGKDNKHFLLKAKDRFLYVLRVDRGNILAAHGLACCLGLQRDYDHCQSLLERVAEVVPNCGYARRHHHAHMANVKTLSESYKQAIDYLEKATPRTPQQDSALAFSLACEGRYDDAVALLTKTVEVHPELPMLLYNLALLHCATFIERIAKTQSLSAEKGRKLREVLERGLSLSCKFTQLQPKSQVMAVARLFLKTVSAYCLNLYDTSLNRLVLIGQENDVEQQREAQRWAEMLASYREDQQRQEEQRARLTAQKAAEQEALGKEVLHGFREKREGDPVRVFDRELIAAGLAELGMDAPIPDVEVDAAPSAEAILAGMQLEFPANEVQEAAS